ncbi:MAG: hypothetical protein ACOCX8_01345 [Bacteroidota bacterium]
MLKRSFEFAIILLAASAVFFTSCADDDDDDIHLAPFVTVTPAQDTVMIAAGDTINYDISVSSEDELTSVKLTTNVGENQQILLDSTLASGVNDFDTSLDLVISQDQEPGTIGHLSVFAATDFESIIVDKYFEVEASMDHYTDVQLQAQADNLLSADDNLSFYSATTNERFTYNQADEDNNADIIDWVFIHHSIYKTNEEMSFQSPDDQNLVTLWEELTSIPFPYNNTNKNLTYFERLFDVDWENLDYQSIEDEIGVIESNTIISDLNEGDFIGFLTEEGKYGIVMITETNPEHDPYNEATITFDVKIQK